MTRLRASATAPPHTGATTLPCSVRYGQPAQALPAIYGRLYKAFGPQHWWPADSPLEVAAGAVLTQNTAWTNVERAIAVLKSRGLLSLGRLARIRPSRLAPFIRAAGCPNVKARRLLALVRWLEATGGFAGLRSRPLPALRASLLACHGVGPETADSILLYALGRPVFVVDAYTRRVLSRVGLIAGTEPYEHLRLMLESSLPRRPRLYNEYHALLVNLAKTHCRVHADCASCPLA
jgi:endonuclease-3 related protein